MRRGRPIASGSEAAPPPHPTSSAVPRSAALRARASRRSGAASRRRRRLAKSSTGSPMATRAPRPGSLGDGPIGEGVPPVVGRRLPTHRRPGAPGRCGPAVSRTHAPRSGPRAPAPRVPRRGAPRPRAPPPPRRPVLDADGVGDRGSAHVGHAEWTSRQVAVPKRLRNRPRCAPAGPARRVPSAPAGRNKRGLGHLDHPNEAVLWWDPDASVSAHSMRRWTMMLALGIRRVTAAHCHSSGGLGHGDLLCTNGAGRPPPAGGGMRARASDRAAERHPGNGACFVDVGASRGEGPFTSLGVLDRMPYESVDPSSRWRPPRRRPADRAGDDGGDRPLRARPCLAEAGGVGHALSDGRLTLGLAIGARPTTTGRRASIPPARGGRSPAAGGARGGVGAAARSPGLRDHPPLAATGRLSARRSAA
jgi:hypothetical protein